MACAASALAVQTPAVQTTYSATETIPVPPASNFSGNAGGDGWGLVMSDTQVFNVFHHSTSLQVACHEQADASNCWTQDPETITDSDGHGFATSGQPGMYLDHSSGKLYVYATRTSDNTGGVVCIDTTQAATNADPFCGFTALTQTGDAYASGLANISNPMQVGGKLYAFNYVYGAAAGGGNGTDNELLCFDLTTDTACANQPFVVAVGSGTDDSGTFPEPADAAIGTDLIIPIVMNNNGDKPELACFDTTTDANCSGTWPASTAISYQGFSGPGAPFPLLGATGSLQGFCLPGGSDPCYGLDGSSATTPTGLASVVSNSSPWNGPAIVLGPRVYVPNGNEQYGVGAIDCFDYSTGASCPNFPFNMPSGQAAYLYTVNPDPQRPTCLWINSDADGGYLPVQVTDFDAYTGGPCGQGPVRALASQFVAPNPVCAPASYTSIQIVSPAPTAYTSGSIQFEDGDGNPIQGVSAQNLDSTGTVDLTGLNLNTASGLPQFLITLNGTSGTPSSVQVKLSWKGDYSATCAPPGGSIADPPIAANGVGTVTNYGLPFNGPVATFTDPDTSHTPSDFTASISWGDGSTSTGAITGGNGSFSVAGSHSFGKPGSFPVVVAITDVAEPSNNASPTSSLVIVMRSTATSLACSPTQATLGSATTCTATVTDTGTGTATTPTGTVKFVSTLAGSFAPASCTLAEVSAGKASCAVQYTPGAAGAVNGITATYGGDATHAPSTGTASLSVGGLTINTDTTQSNSDSSSSPGITISCPPGASGCDGSETITTQLPGGTARDGRSASGSTMKTVTIGQASFTIPAGQSIQTAVALNPLGKLLLSDHLHLPVLVSLVVKGPGQPAVTKTKTVVLNGQLATYKVSDVKFDRDGTATLNVNVSTPGQLLVMVTAWNDNIARLVGKHPSYKTLLEPASLRFVVSRTTVTAAKAGKLVVKLTPSAQGRLLMSHHTYKPTFRLWVSYIPAYAAQQNVGFYGLHAATYRTPPHAHVR
jgi:hypothetical protein